MKTALITGITGQTGSYLAELLLEQGYTVHGVQRPSSSINTGRIDHIYDRLQMHYADLSSQDVWFELIRQSKPQFDEVYNLAAQSHVQVSFQMPLYTKDINEDGALRLLSCLPGAVYGQTNWSTKFYQASTSEMFGNAATPTQNEQTPMHPCSPYGVSKYRAYQQVCSSRTVGHFAVNGILFNHTSERQKETFVTRKITKAAARIKLGLQKELYLGNLEAKRDFGHAKDYARAIWMMMQHERPDDFVIATGEQHSVKDVLDEAFGYLNLDWRDYVKIDPRLYRPTELHSLCGDATKARNVLGWEPSITFSELVYGMVDADMRTVKASAQSYSTLSL